jgi:hypothetical protein
MGHATERKKHDYDNLNSNETLNSNLDVVFKDDLSRDMKSGNNLSFCRSPTVKNIEESIQKVVSYEPEQV